MRIALSTGDSTNDEEEGGLVVRGMGRKAILQPGRRSMKHGLFVLDGQQL